MWQDTDDTTSSFGLWTLFISGVLLLIGLITLLGSRGGRRERVAFTENAPRSLRRTTFSAPTRNTTERTFVAEQFAALGNPNPGAPQIDLGQNDLRQNVFGRREFAVRHVVADRFLRWAVVEILRAPTRELVEGMQTIFDAFGGGALAGQWRGLQNRLLAPGWQGRRWHQGVGRTAIAALRRNLTNCLGNLFLSESQSNLRAGTRPDVTPEALGLLGREHTSQIMNALIPQLEKMGLRPQLAFVRGNLMIDYSGASGEYAHYGYDPRRSQDASSNPLSLLSWRNTATVAGNTGMVTLIRTAFQVYPVRTICVIALLLYTLSLRLGSE